MAQVKPTSDSRPVVILMAEDDEDDALLAKEAMADDKLSNDLYVVPNGLEALRFLRKEPVQITMATVDIPEPEDLPTPDLILLDLMMPVMDGQEFLAQVKQDRLLRRIPVVVFTSSDSETDAAKAWELGAATYIVKPIDLMQFRSIVQRLHEYWMTIVRFEGRPVKDD